MHSVKLKSMNKLSIILHDIRSAHNVGSILRSADAFGIDTVYIGGYSPYPKINGDDRLPHVQLNQTNKISKTALGAESTIHIEHYDSLEILVEELKHNHYKVVGLEQHPRSTPIRKFVPSQNTAIIVGREVEGISPSVLDICDDIVEIPMFGMKESLNVSVASAIAMYEFHQ